MAPKLPIILYEDNESTILCASRKEGCKRLKHVDVRDKYVTEKVVEGLIKMVHVRSSEQLADILTKQPTKEMMDMFVAKAMVRASEI